MLVLKRKTQEEIKIGDDIVIKILRIRGRAVSVGVEAPKGLRILRAELPQNTPAGTTDSHAVDIEKDSPPTGSAVRTLYQPLAHLLESRKSMTARLTPALLNSAGLTPLTCAAIG